MESKTVKLDLRDLLKTLYKLRDDIDSYIETLEILLDKDAIEALKEAEEDIKKGNIVMYEDLRKRSGL